MTPVPRPCSKSISVGLIFNDQATILSANERRLGRTGVQNRGGTMDRQGFADCGDRTVRMPEDVVQLREEDWLFFDPPLAASPTDARPGSLEKVAVLCQRRERREALWHPDDRQWPVCLVEEP
jgi:hypothetical protein